MKSKALVIDDSRTMRHMLSSFLSAYEIEAIEAANGAEALEQLSAHPDADLALLDWDMPVMNGFDFLKKVRAERSYDNLVIMMVTAQSGMAELAKAMNEGANDYLMKPFDQEMVREKLVLLGYAN